MSPANGALDPATLAILKAVFDEACNLLPPDRRSHEMRSILAVRILKCAAKGERNPQQLRTYALMQVTRRSSVEQAEVGRSRREHRPNAPVQKRQICRMAERALIEQATIHPRATEVKS